MGLFGRNANARLGLVGRLRLEKLIGAQTNGNNPLNVFHTKNGTLYTKNGTRVTGVLKNLNELASGYQNKLREKRRVSRINRIPNNRGDIPLYKFVTTKSVTNSAANAARRMNAAAAQRLKNAALAAKARANANNAAMRNAQKKAYENHLKGATAGVGRNW
jgi:hypothetical protein